jgi:hypothetical protein
MAGPSVFERWLIALATMRPPAGREEWARAMRAEFETLERGRAGWALGCFGASIGWRLRGNLGILAATLLFAALRDRIIWIIWLPVVWASPLLSDQTVRAIGYASNWSTLTLFCLILAAVRPRLWILIGIGVPFVSTVIGLAEFVAHFHQGMEAHHQSFWKIHIMDAQLDVGIGAYIGYSFIGALVGRGLGEHFRRAVARS